MPAAFPMTKNEEFYPFLKASLPPDWRIEANPQTGYFSEFFYNYTLIPPSANPEVITGNFREIEPGFLVQYARQILDRSGTTN